jgi:hypothetical protein
MDAEIEDIKRRAGLLNEQDIEMSPYKDLDLVLKDEAEFLGKLGVLLTRAVPATNIRQILAIIGNRRQELEKFHREKVGGAQQKKQQAQQQKNFKDAELQKSGGPRRPA